jgi:hypothetical protein
MVALLFADLSVKIDWMKSSERAIDALPSQIMLLITENSYAVWSPTWRRLKALLAFHCLLNMQDRLSQAEHASKTSILCLREAVYGAIRYSWKCAEPSIYQYCGS